MNDQFKFQKELTEFIIHHSWETTNGKLSETQIFDALQMARKYHGLQIFRGYEYQKPSE